MRQDDRAATVADLEHNPARLNRLRCVLVGAPSGAPRQAMRDIGQAAQRSGRPPGHNPRGRGPLRRGGGAGLARSPATPKPRVTLGTPLLTAPQMAPAQAIQSGRTML